jgi:hypothetical protein
MIVYKFLKDHRDWCSYYIRTPNNPNGDGRCNCGLDQAKAEIEELLMAKEEARPIIKLGTIMSAMSDSCEIWLHKHL